jgi:hypothetical protein
VDPVTDQVLVVDNGNNRVQRFEEGVFADEIGGNTFVSPYDVDVSSFGKIAVCDSFNRVLFYFPVKTGGGFFTFDGSLGSDVGFFDGAESVKIGPTGNVAVCDLMNNRVQVLQDNSVPGILRARVTDVGTPPTVQWQYEDQTISGNIVPFGSRSMLFAPGVVIATVTATDACGATASRSVPITAAESWPLPPLGGVGCSVAIDARFPPFAPVELTAVVLGLDTDQPLFEWDFGDGTPLVPTLDSQVRHAYTPAGMYQVRVEVFDADGTCMGTRLVDFH